VDHPEIGDGPRRPCEPARLARRLVKSAVMSIQGGVPPLGPPLVLPDAPDPRPGPGLVAAQRRRRRSPRFLLKQSRSWRRGASRSHFIDGSIPQAGGYPTTPGPRHLCPRPFPASPGGSPPPMIEVRRRVQRVGPPGSRPAFDPDIFRSRYPPVGPLRPPRPLPGRRPRPRSSPGWLRARSRHGGSSDTSTAYTSPRRSRPPTRPSAPSPAPTENTG